LYIQISQIYRKLPPHQRGRFSSVESERGLSPLPSHGTVREPLNSYGSSCLITNAANCYGCTNVQCGNKLGRSLYLVFKYLIAALSSRAILARLRLPIQHRLTAIETSVAGLLYSTPIHVLAKVELTLLLTT